MKLLTVFLIVGGLLIYVLICAAIIQGLEKSNELTMAMQSTRAFNQFKADRPCLKPGTINKMLDQMHTLLVSGLGLSPSGVSGSSWDFPSSIFMCLQTISGSGFGASAPKTAGGKAFLIFYTFFGLALFIASALAIGEQLMHFVDFVRRKIGIKGRLRTAYFIHTLRITLLIVVGILIFGVIPAGIFSAINPDFGFKEAFSVVSVAIVGYADLLNDVELMTPWYRVGICAWAILSLLWFAATFSTLRHILSSYNSGAIEIPACGTSKNEITADDVYVVGPNTKPPDCNLNPFECNKEEADPYPTDNMIHPVVKKAVIVMGRPHEARVPIGTYDNFPDGIVYPNTHSNMISTGLGNPVNVSAYLNQGYLPDDLVYPTSRIIVSSQQSPYSSFQREEPGHVYDPFHTHSIVCGTRNSVNINGY